MSKVYNPKGIVITFDDKVVEGYYKLPQPLFIKDGSPVFAEDYKDQQFKLGQQLCLEGLSYTQIAKKLGTVNSAVWCGFDDINRVTRCLYSERHWSRCATVKTTADLRTLF